MHDIREAVGLVARAREATAVVGDRAYDSDAFVAHVEALGMKVVIPSRKRRRVVRTLDGERYRTRNVIERFFGRLKQFRRFATRYDKSVASFSSFVSTASLVVVLTGWSA